MTFEVYSKWTVYASDANSSMTATSVIGGSYSSGSKVFRLNVDQSMKELVDAFRHEGTHLTDDVNLGMNIKNTSRKVLEQRAYGSGYTAGQPLTPDAAIQALNSQYSGSNWQIDRIDQRLGGTFSIGDITGGP